MKTALSVATLIPGSGSCSKNASGIMVILPVMVGFLSTGTFSGGSRYMLK